MIKIYHVLFVVLLCSWQSFYVESNNECISIIGHRDYIYVGIDNYINISKCKNCILGLGRDSTNVISSNKIASISKSMNNFIVNIKKHQQPFYLSAYQEISGDTILLGSKIFKIKKLPNPYAVLDIPQLRNEQTKMLPLSKTQIMEAKKILALFGDLEIETAFPVQSFNLLTYNNGEEIISYSASDTLTFEQKNNILALENGQHFIMKDITVKMPNNEMREISPIIYRLK